MTGKQFGAEWTKEAVLKSALLFLLQFVIFLGIAFLVLFGGRFSQVMQIMKEQGANYLYAVVCILMLFVIAYCYFYFENREILLSGKNIALIFTIIDLHLILSCIIGYKFNIYARPVALVALLVFVLIGRRDAIFMNILCALVVFIIDTFAVPEVTAKECYSSLIISFSAGMFAIFSSNRS